MTNYQGIDEGLANSAIPDHGRHPREKPSALPSLGEIESRLGEDVGVLIEAPHGTEIEASRTTLYDGYVSADEATQSTGAAVTAGTPGAIAIGIGFTVRERLDSQLRWLVAAGCVALVCKVSPTDEPALRAAARTAGIAVFRANQSISWDQLAEILTAAIGQSASSTNSLADIRPGDLFDLANTVAAITGGAIAICDPDQTLLAYSTVAGQPIDATRRASILGLHVPHTEQNDSDYQRVHRSAAVQMILPTGDSYPRLAIAIRAGNTVLGSLWQIGAPADSSPDVRSNPPGNERDAVGAVLNDAAAIAALHLLHRRRHRSAARTRQIELVRPLLFDSSRAELAAIQLGLAASNLRVVSLACYGASTGAPETVERSHRLYDSIATSAAVWLPTAVCGLADNVVYLAIGADGVGNSRVGSNGVGSNGVGSSSVGTQDDEPSNYLTDVLLRICRQSAHQTGHPVAAGVGSPRTIAELTESRTEAETVLGVLLRDLEDGRLTPDSDGMVSTATELGPRLQLRQMVNALRAVDLLPGDQLAGILAHDRAKGTAFAATILAFFESGTNAIETAARLRLHANTVRYRLSRIEPLFGLRLADPDTRLLLWLQLWAEGVSPADSAGVAPNPRV